MVQQEAISITPILFYKRYAKVFGKNDSRFAVRSSREGSGTEGMSYTDESEPKACKEIHIY